MRKKARAGVGDINASNGEITTLSLNLRPGGDFAWVEEVGAHMLVDLFQQYAEVPKEAPSLPSSSSNPSRFFSTHSASVSYSRFSSVLTTWRIT